MDYSSVYKEGEQNYEVKDNRIVTNSFLLTGIEEHLLVQQFCGIISSVFDRMC